MYLYWPGDHQESTQGLEVWVEEEMTKHKD